MNQEIKNIALLLIMMTIALTAKAYDCLPMNQKHVLTDSRFIVKTVHHPNYDQAEAMLKQQLPSSGFHQHLKMEEVKKLTSYSYSEQKKLETNLDANIQHWIKYSCHHRGDYYITAVIGKEDIKYIDLEIPKEINLKDIYKFCNGYNKIMLAYGSNNLKFFANKQKEIRIKLGKDKDNYVVWHIGCGKAKAYSVHTEHKIFHNELDNFLFYEMANNSTQDTIGMWLELTKSLK